jgi:hypothetical protein
VREQHSIKRISSYRADRLEVAFFNPRQRAEVSRSQQNASAGTEAIAHASPAEATH